MEDNQIPAQSRKKYSRISPEKKFEIFLASVKQERDIGDLLRREGLYASDLSRYRKLIREGAIEKLASTTRRGPSLDQKRIAVLEEELRKRNEVIARLSMERMILEKKVNGE